MPPAVIPIPLRTPAARIHRFGPPDVIVVEEVDCPTPGADEVLVRVAAAGVGPWDAWIRSGTSALPQPLPLTLGSDLSGVVAACGDGVGAFRPGDAVFGVTNPQFTGAQAGYAVARSGMLAARPDSLADPDAASVPVVAITAWQALFEQARLRRGQAVLIHGGAGNVGAFAIQLARHAGLDVTATASVGDLDLVRRLGAQTVIDHRTTRFETVVRGMDAVIDLVGGETQERSFAVVRPGGALISAVSQPDQQRAATAGVRATFFLVQVTTERLERIGDMLQRGILETAAGAVLPLADVRGAHAMLAGDRPRPRGKIVLLPGAGDGSG